MCNSDRRFSAVPRSVPVLVNDNMADHSTTTALQPARKQLIREWFENAIRNQDITFIEYDEISKIELASRGGFAIIMSGKWRGELVALKFLETALRFDSDDLATF